MTSARGPAAVLWDLDGTLINTEPHWMAAQQQLARRWSVPWDEVDAASTVGHSLLVTAARLRERGVGADVPTIVAELTDATLQQLARAVPWRPRARDLVASLQRRGVPCALVTSSHRHLVDAVLRPAGSPTFQTIVTGDMVQRPKPDPEPYLMAAELLGVDPALALAVEDSTAGATSAAAAGARVVLLHHDAEPPAGPWHYAVRNLEELDPVALWAALPPTGRPVSESA